MIDRPRLSCPDIDELAALYVLDALGTAEAAEVVAHLADHGDRHRLFAELAGITPFLAESIEAVAPPPDLRARVLAGIAATPQLVRPATTAAQPAPVAQPAWSAAPAVQPAWSPEPSAATGAQGPISIEEARRRRARPSPVRAILAAAAVLAIVVLGGWNVLLQQQNGEADRRLALLTDAVTAAGQPGAAVVPMTGSETAAGAGGYAVFPPDGPGYIVLTGLPPVSADSTWQAWTIAAGEAPTSAGLMRTGADGLAILENVERIPGTSIVALTVEPAGGSEAPTTTPVVVGQLGAPLAWSGHLVAFLP